MAEIATVRKSELLFDKPHPFGHQICLNPADALGNWIRRLRDKTDVYGEWRLWPITVAALNWIMTLRPHPERVVVPKAGATFTSKTSGTTRLRTAGIGNWTEFSKTIPTSLAIPSTSYVRRLSTSSAN
jgi:hypothetical protein